MFKRLFGLVPDQWLLNYAHAVVEVNSNRASAPTLFVFKVGLETLFSALRWNQSISLAMCKEIKRWIFGR